MINQIQTYGIRSDLHGRLKLARAHEKQVHSGEYGKIIDLGDLEVPYIDEKHPLRKGQKNGERTMDAIVRNVQNSNLAESIIPNALNSIKKMQEFTASMAQRIPYAGIKGNSWETWTKIVSASCPRELDKLKEYLEIYNPLNEAKAQFPTKRHGLLYLPWTASPRKIKEAISILEDKDLARITVLSHDKADEQILERLSKLDAKVDNYFGHIGLRYGQFIKTIEFGNKKVNYHHVDEKGGRLVPLVLKD